MLTARTLETLEDTEEVKGGSFQYLLINILCSIIFSQGYLGRTKGSSSRRGLGGVYVC